ncbi:uncharacterized protein [Haliotis cracherodii]|uniref:uncharacterized protein n=1 Tax=Haliotis cracherodii TaxID=6455 RepID=UPI0039EB139B
MDSMDYDSAGSADDSMASCDQLHVKIHNFGIYKKNGKRAILQLDFPGESIFLIQRGHIKKTYTFEQLQHFDSEEGLHIVLKFKDNEFEFDADNVEEKYTLCRLISLVLDKDEDEEGATTPGIKDSGRRVSVLPTLPMLADKVIKEAVLEKKGNTTITTWNKRRLRITPGEFSYYKPGTELALNIVQVWDDICSVRRSGQHGFNVTVRNRVYSFRLLHDQRANNPEVEREEWIEAFQKAMKSKRHTLVMLEKTLDTPRSNVTAFEFPSQSVEEEPISIDEQIKRRKQSAQQVEENNNEPEQVTMRKPEVTKHFSVHLSYVEKTTPLEHLPTSSRPKPPAFARQDATFRGDVSNVVDGNHSETEVSVDNGTSGTDDVASVRAKWNVMDKKSSENSSDKADVPSGLKKTGHVKTSKREQSTMEVKIDFTEPEPDYPHDDKTSPSSAATTSKSLPLPPPPLIPAPIPAPRTLISSNTEPTTSNTNNTPLNDTAGTNHTDLPPTPTSPAKRAAAETDDKYKDRPLHSPSSPPPPIPSHIPAPPPLKGNKLGIKLKVVPKMKLKQIHWSKVTPSEVSHSLWKNAHDVTSRLDLTTLEDMFALQEKDYVNIQSQASLAKSRKQILLDPKRAQNLSIMFNGPKPDVVEKLTDALNSISEMEAFPTEKLSTLRRYQPTADDMEMYRMYRSTRQEQHPVDRFMIDLCDVPALDIRLDLVITILDFPCQFEELSEEVSLLGVACEELTANTTLTAVLEYVLAIGNYMNAKWTSGIGAHGFQITSIDKVLDIKGRNPHYTLLNFLVEQIRLTNPPLLDWTSGMKHVQKCADLSIKAVGAEVEVLKNGINKIKRNLKALRNTLSSPSKQEKKYMSDVQNFITEYERKIQKMDSTCANLGKRFRSILAYYGEASNRTSDVLFSSVAMFVDKFQTARDKVKT